MKKKTKIAISILSALAVLICIFCGVFLVKPSMEVKKLEKLELADSPTAQYLNNMPQTDEIFGWVEDLVGMGARKPGTDAGKKAQTFMVEKFQSFGIEEVKVIPSESTLWACSDWSFSVAGAEIPSYYMTHSFNNGTLGSVRTPEGGLDAEIIYVGKGSESDFKNVDVKGKIVISDVVFSEIPVGLAKFVSYLFYVPADTVPLFSARANPYSPNTYPYNYYNAMENGAAGFIGILLNYIDSNEFNNEDYSYLGGKMEIPGMWVTKNEGAKIVDIIKKSESAVSANMKMNVDITAVEAGAVTAYLPGNSEEVIMVQSHHDSSTPGAVEDASGAASVLALAKFYAQIPQEERDRSLLFVSMDTHFADYESHDAVIAEYLGEGHTIIANVCIEHIANEVEEVDGEIIFTGEVEPRIIFASKVNAMMQITKEEVVRHGLQRTVMLPTDMFGDEVPADSDMYYQEGVPIISLISGPIYLYDKMDTIDKVPKEELRPVAETFADIIWRLMKLSTEEFSAE